MFFLIFQEFNQKQYNEDAGTSWDNLYDPYPKSTPGIETNYSPTYDEFMLIDVMANVIILYIIYNIKIMFIYKD